MTAHGSLEPPYVSKQHFKIVHVKLVKWWPRIPSQRCSFVQKINERKLSSVNVDIAFAFVGVTYAGELVALGWRKFAFADELRQIELAFFCGKV